MTKWSSYTEARRNAPGTGSGDSSGFSRVGLRLRRDGWLVSLSAAFLSGSGFVAGSLLTTFFTGLLASRPTDFSVAHEAAPLTRMSVPPPRTQSLSRRDEGLAERAGIAAVGEDQHVVLREIEIRRARSRGRGSRG